MDPDTALPARARSRAATISVIVPAYNAALYLDAALAAVAAQMRPADEVVVVNDASSDGTSAVAKRWAACLPLVLVEREENRGLGAARKLAIEHATGELIAPLDADDYWLPDHLAVLEELWYRNGGLASPRHLTWVPGLRLVDSGWGCVPPPEEQGRRILAANFAGYPTLFSKQDYLAAGGYRELRASEDWDLIIRMVRSGCPVSLADTPTLIYRKRPDSLSAGDGCLASNTAILEGLLDDVDGEDRRVVERSLRNHRARRLLLDGLALAEAGRIGAARRTFARAVLTDRSVSPGPTGRVTLHALACMASPRRLASRRSTRLSSLDVLTSS